MKVFITKYALTRGIQKREVNTCPVNGVVQDASTRGIFYCGDTWHLTWEDAYSKAEDMRQKKILSLQKQISKLGKLKFKREEK